MSTSTSPMPDVKKLFHEKFNTKHLIVLIAVLLILFAVLSKRGIPRSVSKIVDNMFFDILLVLIVIYTAIRHKPKHAVLVAIIASMLVIFVKLNSKKVVSFKEDAGMKTIPPYSHSPDGTSTVEEPCYADGELLGGSDGPVIGVSEKEMESLCVPLKERKNKLIDTDFSELMNNDEVTEFAKHQYLDNMKEKIKFKHEKVAANNDLF